MGNQKPVLYVWLEQLRKQREEAEAIECFVALTRARDRLILTAVDQTGGGLDRLQFGFNAAGIPLHLIPSTQTLPNPHPTRASFITEPPRFIIGSIDSGLFELPVTALSEYACCPSDFSSALSKVILVWVKALRRKGWEHWYT
jgi:ATP-dependent helicase/nuclease subunit A